MRGLEVIVDEDASIGRLLALFISIMATRGTEIGVSGLCSVVSLSPQLACETAKNGLVSSRHEIDLVSSRLIFPSYVK